MLREACNPRRVQSHGFRVSGLGPTAGAFGAWVQGSLEGPFRPEARGGWEV